MKLANNSLDIPENCSDPSAVPEVLSQTTAVLRLRGGGKKGCQFCAYNVGSLRPHLKKQESCRNQYLEIYNSSTMEELFKEIKKQERKSFASRSYTARKQENKMTRYEKFMKKVAVSPQNITCSTCLSAGIRKRMTKVTNTDQADKTLSRHDVFYQCEVCSFGVKKYHQEPIFEVIGRLVVPEMNIMAPICSANHDKDNICPTTVLLPTTAHAPKVYDLKRQPQSQVNNVKRLFTRDFVFGEKEYEIILEGELKKIIDINETACVYPGSIVSVDEKKIHLEKPFTNLSKIGGSEDYYLRMQKDFLFTVSQAGSVFLFTELIIPYYTDGSLATQLLLDGVPLLDIKLEQGNIIYHLHSENEDCLKTCQQVSLCDYLNQDPNKQTIKPSTVANYTDHFFRSFIHNVIKNVESDLKPDYYDANLVFPIEASITKCKLSSWPSKFKWVNEKISKKMPFDRQEIMDFVFLIDSVITTSTCADVLETDFGLTEKEAEEVASLAFRYQLSEQVDACVQMPSSITMIKIAPKIEISKSMELQDKYQIIRQKFETKILCMEHWERSVDPLTWLYDLEEEKFVSVHEEGAVIKIMFEDLEIDIDKEQEVSYMMEEYAFNLLEAVYHRSLNFALKSSFDLVIKCESLQSSFIRPFNPMYLLYAKLPVTTRVVGSNYQYFCRVYKM